MKLSLQSEGPFLNKIKVWFPCTSFKRHGGDHQSEQTIFPFGFARACWTTYEETQSAGYKSSANFQSLIFLKIPYNLPKLSMKFHKQPRSQSALLWPYSFSHLGQPGLFLSSKSEGDEILAVTLLSVQTCPSVGTLVHRWGKSPKDMELVGWVPVGSRLSLLYYFVPGTGASPCLEPSRGNGQRNLLAVPRSILLSGYR